MADSTKEEQPTVPEQQIEAKTIKIIVKTPKEKQEFEVIPTITVLALKAKVSEKFKSSVEQLVLIFAGKILKDADTLDVHQIKEAHTVHLVIKSKPAQGSQTTSTPNPTPTSTTPTPTSTANPTQPAQTPPSFPFGGLGGMGGLEGLAGLGGMGGMGSGNLQEMQQRMQQELMSNPQALQQVMENPFVQSMMSNPDVMRQMISNNPQMQNLMERNPEITHMLNNPELMRQTMELARNPAMFQEMMRNQDRAMSNLESIPGGYNALRRLYTDVQEPMLNAAQEQFNPNPFASLVQNSGESQGSQNAENTSPLPNPWGGSGGTQPPTTTQTPTTTTPTTANQSHGTMFNTPAMQNLMQQITGNPEMMQSMMNAPYMQTMMQSLTNNPDLAAQLMSQNPAFANNPQLREMMPQILQQMQSPQMQSLYSNPRAMEAMMQMQQAMQTLQQEAPGVMPNLMGPFGGATATGLNTSSTTPSTTTTTTQSSTNSATPPVIPPNVLSQMLQSLGTGGAPASTTPQVNPETRFQTQLEQLTSMGFFNREANLRALVVNNGNLSAAIDWLLSSHQS